VLIHKSRSPPETVGLSFCLDCRLMSTLLFFQCLFGALVFLDFMAVYQALSE
jgi:hypothetical protein